jgi:hypothetical protein
MLKFKPFLLHIKRQRSAISKTKKALVSLSLSRLRSFLTSALIKFRASSLWLKAAHLLFHIKKQLSAVSYQRSAK